MCARGCKSRPCAAIVLVFGIVNLLSGIIILGSFSTLLNDLFVKYLKLTPDSYSYGLWKETPIPMFVKFYFLNWTNPDDFINYQAMPRFQEVGPYTYHEKRVKININWIPDNSSVNYMQRRTWTFAPELSHGTESDVIRSLNVPLISAASVVKKFKSKLFAKIFNEAVNTLEEKIYIDKSVGDLIFNGVETPLMKLAADLPPGLMPYDKFGWFYTRNNSPYYDGVFNMYTGVGNISKLGQINTWNYSRRNDFYPDYCGMINGSAGELFPIHLQENQVNMYVPDLCRSITLNFHQEMTFHNLQGYSYIADKTLFENPPDSSRNWCFCSSSGCKRSGVLDVSSCRFGTPTFISYPHFMFADPVYLSKVQGLTPNVSKHITSFDLEPETGVPLAVYARFQINMYLEKVPYVDLFTNISEIMFPSLWFETSALLTPEIAFHIRLLKWSPVLCVIAGTITIIIGLCLMMVGCVILSRIKRSEKALLDDSSSLHSSIPEVET